MENDEGQIKEMDDMELEAISGGVNKIPTTSEEWANLDLFDAYCMAVGGGKKAPKRADVKKALIADLNSFQSMYQKGKRLGYKNANRKNFTKYIAPYLYIGKKLFPNRRIKTINDLSKVLGVKIII